MSVMSVSESPEFTAFTFLSTLGTNSSHVSTNSESSIFFTIFKSKGFKVSSF